MRMSKLTFHFHAFFTAAVTTSVEASYKHQMMHSSGNSNALQDMNFLRSTQEVENRGLQDCPFSDEQCLCLGAIAGANFDITQTADFSQWFDDTSEMQLAQGGTYEGLDGIEEYVNFIYTPFLFTGDLKTLDLTPVPSSINYDPNRLGTGQCEVAVAIKTCRSLNPETTNGGSYDVLIGYKLFFNILKLPPSDPFQILIKRTHLFYPGAYLINLFDGSFNNKVVFKRVCKIMQKNCAETFESNFDGDDLKNTKKCEEEMSSLPTAEGQGYIDGDTSGCRILHAAFAEENSFHCPHISFKAEADPKGAFKCQQSSSVPVSVLFDANETTAFSNIASNYYGLPEMFTYHDALTCPEKYPEAYNE